MCVGETARSGKTRKREHVDAVKISNTKNVSAESTSYGFRSSSRLGNCQNTD